MHKLIARVFDKSRDSSFVGIYTNALREEQFVFGDLSGRNAPLAITNDHRQCATRQVSQTTGEVAVRAIDQCLVPESPVLAKHHLAQTEVAHSVGRKVTMQDVEID